MGFSENAFLRPADPEGKEPYPGFRCRRCGACCRWEGPVRVNEREISAIASLIQIPEEEFIRKYTVLAPDRKSLSLTEKEDGSCFWLDDDKGCLIQQAKPQQCKDFPQKWSFPGWEELCAGGEPFRKKKC